MANDKNTQALESAVKTTSTPRNTEQSVKVPIIVPKKQIKEEIETEHPFCSLPSHYFDALLARSSQTGNSRNLFSLETWEGRKVFGFEMLGT